MKLGSLFDGAGGFPLAGMLAGFEPVWASEIEPFPIRVTSQRFPCMKHLGDITKIINGADIEPVDCITFGSPCQDLSVANGNRKGLGGARSGLFWEAVRIIREMREATHGRSPAFIVWENVVGAFSSNKGEDFRQVLEEIAKIADKTVSIPRPAPRKRGIENGKWPSAGEYVGDGWSIAYRTYDAQFWGVPQRRRRIYLVADFGAGRAGRIQFERESLLRDFAPRGSEGQGIAGKAVHCIKATGRVDYLTPWESQRRRVFGEDGVSPTLDGSDGGGGRNPGGLVLAEAVARGIGYGETAPTFKSESGGDSIPCVTTAGFNGHKSVTGNICYSTERSPCIETHMPPNVLYPDTARSLTARFDSSPCIDRGQQFIAIENYPADSRVKLSGGVFQTLSNRMGTGGNNTPMVLCIPIDLRQAVKNSKNGDNCGMGVGENCQPSFTITAGQPHAVFTAGKGQAHDLYLDEKARTLNCLHAQQIAVIQESKVKYRVRRLTPLECCRLQGFPDHWTAGLELNGISEKMLKRWAKKDRKVPRRIRKRLNKWVIVFSTHRRITDPEKKPKTRNQIVKWLKNPHSDSAEYKMWGNSIAVPCAYTVLAGIAEELSAEINNA